jgi:hypothetical protein
VFIVSQPHKSKFGLLKKQVERIVKSLKPAITIRLAAGEIVFVFTEKHAEHLKGVGNIRGSHLAAGNQSGTPFDRIGYSIMLGKERCGQPLGGKKG